MSIIRVNKTSDYTVMSNTHFREKEMSLKAKGLLSLMLSLPDDWDYSISGLVSICKENESAIKSTLNELKTHGYLSIIKKMPGETESGRIEYEYNIYEKPQLRNESEKQEARKQDVENLPVEILDIEFQDVENQGQLNTNISNTKESNTKKLNTKDKKEKKTSSRFQRPTLDEVKAYCIERKNNVDAERFIDYYDSNGWMVGKNKMKDWKAAVRTWERNSFDNNTRQQNINTSTNSDFSDLNMGMLL